MWVGKVVDRDDDLTFISPRASSLVNTMNLNMRRKQHRHYEELKEGGERGRRMVTAADDEWIQCKALAG
jgi:predicted esterase